MMTKIDIAVELAKRVYLEHGAGGILHICLDDGNLSDENFRWCLYECDAKPVTWAELECGEFWRTLTESEKLAAYARISEYSKGNPTATSFSDGLIDTSFFSGVPTTV